MSETRKYFDLEIGDIIKFYVGSDECLYPMTFTVEECVEEYCEMHGMSLVRIVEDSTDNGGWRSGVFLYERLGEKSWADTFERVRTQLSGWASDI